MAFGLRRSSKVDVALVGMYRLQIMSEIVGSVLELFFAGTAAIRFTQRSVCALLCGCAILRLVLVSAFYIIYLSDLTACPYLLAFEIPCIFLFMTSIIDVLHIKELQNLQLSHYPDSEGRNSHFSAIELGSILFSVFLSFYGHEYILNGDYALSIVTFLGSNGTLFLLIYEFIKNMHRNVLIEHEFQTSSAFEIDVKLRKLCDELYTVVEYNGIVMRRVFIRSLMIHLCACLALVLYIGSYQEDIDGAFVAYEVMSKIMEFVVVVMLLLGFENKDSQDSLREYQFKEGQNCIEQNRTEDWRKTTLMGIYR